MLVQSAGIICVRARRMCARARERERTSGWIARVRARTHAHARARDEPPSHSPSGPIPQLFVTPFSPSSLARRCGRRGPVGGHAPKNDFLPDPAVRGGLARRTHRVSDRSLHAHVRLGREAPRPDAARTRYCTAHTRSWSHGDAISARVRIAHNRPRYTTAGPTARATAHSWRRNVAASADQWRRMPGIPPPFSPVAARRLAADAAFLKSRTKFRTSCSDGEKTLVAEVRKV